MSDEITITREKLSDLLRAKLSDINTQIINLEAQIDNLQEEYQETESLYHQL